jgi:hypothetical protein
VSSKHGYENVNFTLSKVSLLRLISSLIILGWDGNAENIFRVTVKLQNFSTYQQTS